MVWFRYIWFVLVYIYLVWFGLSIPVCLVYIYIYGLFWFTYISGLVWFTYTCLVWFNCICGRITWFGLVLVYLVWFCLVWFRCMYFWYKLIEVCLSLFSLVYAYIRFGKIWFGLVRCGQVLTLAWAVMIKSREGNVLTLDYSLAGCLQNSAFQIH